MFLYLCIFFKDFLFHLVFAHSEPVGNLCVKHPNDLGSEQAGILCTVDRNGRNRDAGRHLNGRKQCVQPVQGGGLDRDPDNRQGGVCGENPL